MPMMRAASTPSRNVMTNDWNMVMSSGGRDRERAGPFTEAGILKNVYERCQTTD